MKITNTRRRIALGIALPLALMASIAPSQAQPGKPGGKKGAAIKHAEAVLGKPLTPAQKKAVRAAQKQRTEALKPIQEKFRADVAKALGLTVAQYDEREKALKKPKTP
jgi:hypothetical protein